MRGVKRKREAERKVGATHCIQMKIRATTQVRFFLFILKVSARIFTINSYTDVKTETNQTDQLSNISKKESL